MNRLLGCEAAVAEKDRLYRALDRMVAPRVVAPSPKSPWNLLASYLPLVLLAGFEESKLSEETPLPFRSMACFITSSGSVVFI